MRVHSMGINIRHEDTFMIDRPVGLGDDLLLIFKSDAALWCGDRRCVVPAGGFVLFKKGSRQKYGAADGEYANHYIHFDCGDERYLDEAGVWTDRPGFLRNIEEVENLIRLISREHISASDFRHQNTDLMLRLLIRKLAENQCEAQDERKNARHFEELTRLRSEIYATPARYGSVEELARAANLSLSYFKALYSAFFAVGCYEDLLNARIRSSKEFLRSSDLAIREIAGLCGYESDTCFMRCFKKREGMTPSAYREQARGKQTTDAG